MPAPLEAGRFTEFKLFLISGTGSQGPRLDGERSSTPTPSAQPPDSSTEWPYVVRGGMLGCTVGVVSLSFCVVREPAGQHGRTGSVHPPLQFVEALFAAHQFAHDPHVISALERAANDMSVLMRVVRVESLQGFDDNAQVLTAGREGVQVTLACEDTGVFEVQQTRLQGHGTHGRGAVLEIVEAELGEGAIDAGLNAYGTTHFSTRPLNWRHASWGLSTALDLLIVTGGLISGNI